MSWVAPFGSQLQTRLSSQAQAAVPSQAQHKVPKLRQQPPSSYAHSHVQSIGPLLSNDVYSFQVTGNMTQGHSSTTAIGADDTNHGGRHSSSQQPDNAPVSISYQHQTHRQAALFSRNYRTGHEPSDNYHASPPSNFEPIEPHLLNQVSTRPHSPRSHHSQIHASLEQPRRLTPIHTQHGTSYQAYSPSSR